MQNYQNIFYNSQLESISRNIEINKIVKIDIYIVENDIKYAMRIMHSDNVEEELWTLRKIVCDYNSGIICRDWLGDDYSDED